MGHKRKRQSETTTADEPSLKKPATETTTSNNAAERRQKRSERRTKKAHESKENASRTKPKNKSKYENNKKSSSELHTAASPELVKAAAATTTKDDHLAGGQDFVPLTDSTSTDIASKAPSKAVKKSAANTKPKSTTERKNTKTQKPKASEENASVPNTTSDAQKSNTRFIAFVGNLPYSTTTPQITAHFRKLTPASIRHPTDKATGKSKGYAFLEFDNYSAMKTCLKVYHHSMFDPERTSKLPDDAFDEDGLEIVKPGQEKRRSGRRINVELTAGGGGKGEGRKEKIRVKNTRLEEQRDRRREVEIKVEKAKSRRRGVSDVNQVQPTEKEDERGAIHPSRLKRVQA